METKTRNIYEKIETIRVELQRANVKKSGKNAFAGFEYFTLDDILPTLNCLMLENKIFSNFSMDTETATLTLINVENPEEVVVFSSPIAEAQIKGSTPIQCLGGVHTYMKRYLYLNAFEIVEGDVLDALAGSDKLEAKGSYKPKTAAEKKPAADSPAVENAKPAAEVINLDYERACNVKIKSGKMIGELDNRQLQWLLDNNASELTKAAAKIVLDRRAEDSKDIPF